MMSPRILKAVRARLAQPLGQRGPRPGPRWPVICQVIDFALYIHPPVVDVEKRRFASLFKSLRPACSLLRQVCIFSGWNRRPFPLSGLFHLGDGAACLADVSPR